MIPKKLTQNGWCVWRVKTNKTDWGYGIGSMIGKATSESFTMKERETTEQPKIKPPKIEVFYFTVWERIFRVKQRDQKVKTIDIIACHVTIYRYILPSTYLLTYKIV